VHVLFAWINGRHQAAADAAAPCPTPPTQGELDLATAQVASAQEELALALQHSRHLEEQVSGAQAQLDDFISADQALVAQLQSELEQERAGGTAAQERCAELEVGLQADAVCMMLLA
jgi:hypothetical protein